MNTHAKSFCLGFNTINTFIKASRVVANTFDDTIGMVDHATQSLRVHTKCFYRGARTAWSCRELQITKLEVIGNG